MFIHNRIAAAIVAVLAVLAPSAARAEGVLPAIPSPAQPSPQPPAMAPNVRVDGFGAAVCARVTADFKVAPTIVATALVQWTYGYMTRRNVERAFKNEPAVDIAAAVTDEKLLRVMLQTCEMKPDLRIYQVADALYDLLLQKNALTS